MRLLICGSRDWTDRDAIRAKLEELRPALVIHGAHWSGADAIAAELCIELGIPQQPYPAQWRDSGRSAGPRRNQQMLNEGRPDQVLAFHLHRRQRGTDDMIRRAHMLQIPIKVVWDKEKP